MESKAIKDLTPHEEDWAIQVRVVRKTQKETIIKPTRKTEIMKLFLLDLQGTLVQATVFNDLIKKFNEILESGKSYEIRNGSIGQTNTHYAYVNEKIEITFTRRTQVEEINQLIPYQRTRPFVPFNDIERVSADQTHIDVIGIVLGVKPPLIIKLQDKDKDRGTTKKREVTLIDKMSRKIKLDLWGDLATNEGAVLGCMSTIRPTIVALNVKLNKYEGDIKLSTTRISIIELNPQVEESEELQQSVDKLDTEIMGPSKRMIESEKASLTNIVASNVDSLYCSFVGKVVKILNKSNPWYQRCNYCNDTVDPEGSNKTAFCNTCNENCSFTRHYRLKLLVTDGKNEVFATLFDAAETIIGSPVKMFAETLLTVRDQDKHAYDKYKNLLSCIDKEFRFFVKVDTKRVEDRAKNIIIVEEVVKQEKLSQENRPLKNKRKQPE